MISRMARAYAPQAAVGAAGAVGGARLATRCRMRPLADTGGLSRAIDVPRDRANAEAGGAAKKELPHREGWVRRHGAGRPAPLLPRNWCERAE